MINKKHFFDTVRRSLFGGKLTQSQVLGLDTIINEYDSNFSMIGFKQLAYVLATVFHETDRKMQPIEEYESGRKKKDYGKFFKDADGKIYGLKMGAGPGRRIRYYSPQLLFFGRGFVQLTWFENYEKAGDKLGLDMLNKPELALNLEVATKILFLGMIEGWFTGRKLSQFMSKDGPNYYGMRSIINGKDKASLIAEYARSFSAALIEDL